LATCFRRSSYAIITTKNGLGNVLGDFFQTHLVTLSKKTHFLGVNVTHKMNGWFRRLWRPMSNQGCQMVYFQTKNPHLGKFWRAFKWKKLEYSMTIWNILRPFGIFYGHLVYFVSIWYIFVVILVYFSRFGMLCKEKSGNPEVDYVDETFSAEIYGKNF
jgi:hypothetical protein